MAYSEGFSNLTPQTEYYKVDILRYIVNSDSVHFAATMDCGGPV